MDVRLLDSLRYRACRGAGLASVCCALCTHHLRLWISAFAAGISADQLSYDLHPNALTELDTVKVAKTFAPDQCDLKTKLQASDDVKSH